MNKSVIFILFLMAATLLIETSVHMNMIYMTMASENNRDDKRYHYEVNNRYLQSTYEQDTYTSMV
jgi:hypothetical protein